MCKVEKNNINREIKITEDNTSSNQHTFGVKSASSTSKLDVSYGLLTSGTNGASPVSHHMLMHQKLVQHHSCNF